jgi:hypothetical protein
MGKFASLVGRLEPIRFALRLFVRLNNRGRNEFACLSVSTVSRSGSAGESEPGCQSGNSFEAIASRRLGDDPVGSCLSAHPGSDSRLHD